jgi:N-acetyl-anhydromuramyl-L-alanine amidase AmpD
MVTTSTNLTTNRYIGHAEPVSLIGIHTMEAPEDAATAENVANYFKNPAVQASAHWCVDDNSRVRCVDDADSAWAMPPTNNYSLNIEIAGYASQTAAEWSDTYSKAALDIAALCAAEWCLKYGIPVRHLTDAQIANKEKGFAGHIDVNRVFHASDHTDPGANFPWPYFLGLVNGHLALLKGKPVTAPTAQSGKPNCTALQKAVRTTQDNAWGTNTDKNCSAVYEATDYYGNKFPFDVVFAQYVVGTQQDGAWGPNSKSALRATVANMQEALHAMGFPPGFIDGVWGANTDKAYKAARAACHI